ncbi:MAG: penicillin-binding protein 1C [Marinifilaceae bacterium]|nr:penicillin-binding protein 1C [Marinifilaceae bacterium]
MKKRYRSKRSFKFYSFISCVIFIIIYFTIPVDYFPDDYSTSVYSVEGEFIGGKLSSDEQWRFRLNDSINDKFETCLLCFEDKYFYYHPGVNPWSIVKAIYYNISQNKVVSGASTISMQVVRMSQKNKRRTYLQKIKEIFLALSLELHYSKNDILKMYCQHAPFGGNIVGLESASWRYFNQDSRFLSWSEAAMLAVLPNAPSLMFPGKNNSMLKAKRDKLLKSLLIEHKIDSLTYSLSVEEEIPNSVFPIPSISQHFTDKVFKEHRGERLRTTINYSLQNRLNRIIKKHNSIHSTNDINNLCALILDVNSGDVLAYTGNSRSTSKYNKNHSCDVDIIQSKRSTGSLLKPILYAAMIDAGKMTAKTLLADVPINISGYKPRNFNKQYSGACSADKALAMSLNIPAVNMLKDYGIENFILLLNQLGVTSINKNSSYYGLTLILGGAESSLYELSNLYANMARILKFDYGEKSLLRKPNYLADVNATKYSFEYLSKASVYECFKALLEVNRPLGESGWQSFSSSKKISWKTGTSFGFKDAWSIGTDGKYVVGVWAGNADGEGRPGLTGLRVAAPVMFDVFNILPNSNWFERPYQEMKKIKICKNSGHVAGRFCSDIDSINTYKKCERSKPCPYCRIVHTKNTKASNGVDVKKAFVLPPIMEYYYSKSHPFYEKLPLSSINSHSIEFVYPVNNANIYIPKLRDETRGFINFELACRNPQDTVFWHLDGKYIGQTNEIHQMLINADFGRHRLTVMNKKAVKRNCYFNVISKD